MLDEVAVLRSMETLRAKLRAHVRWGGAVASAAFGYCVTRSRLRSDLGGPALDVMLRDLCAEPAPLPMYLSLRDLARTVALAERGIARVPGLPNTCLFRALARFGTLVRHGHAPVFVLGVRDELDGEGHAWVEVDGSPFLEASLPRFVRTFTFSALEADAPLHHARVP